MKKVKEDPKAKIEEIAVKSKEEKVSDVIVSGQSEKLKV